MKMIPEYVDVMEEVKRFQPEIPFYMFHYSLDYRYPHHYHDFAELMFITDGEGTEILNGRVHRLSAGSITFLLPHHLHEIVPKTPLLTYCCMFDLKMFYDSPLDTEIMKYLFRAGVDLPSYVDLPPEQAKSMETIMGSLFGEWKASKPGKSLIIRSKLIEALFGYIRAALASSLPATGENKAEETDAVWDVIHHVHLHYADELSLGLIAKEMGVSMSKISRIFKAQVGKSFLEYVHSIRIHKAATMLSTTTMSVTDISAEVGFDSYRTFTRVFKSLMGSTPSEYRLIASHPSSFSFKNPG
ncbi:AraC family transcriptional regulator [Paenibacillus sp. MBLB4367]|uniref:helix-turn-helix transcriptional regulator n=1 Tax=Paenibacillus sp. MBLB4367 TaxID=3384767 RepID=UPI003908327D